MIELNPRSLRVASVLAGLCVLLLGCPPPKSPPPGSNATNGPSGEEDRPIVMDGSSFKVTWEEKANDAEKGFDPDDGLYKHSKNGTANLINCNLGKSFDVKRKNNQPLIVMVALDATNYQWLQASTKKTGKHLVMALVREYTGSSAPELRHPDPNAKIKQVVLENVVYNKADLPPTCSEIGSGRGISCDTSQVSAPSVKIHVCQGNKCADPAQ